MRVVIVYESMFGNTRAVAEAIAAGMDLGDGVTVVPVGQAGPEVVAGADLVLLGAPTHMHGLSRASSRRMAGEMAGKPDSGVTLEPGAAGPGVREWLDTLGTVDVKAAAFDTKMQGPAAFTGRAAKGIGRRLRRHGAHVVCAPESFVVDKQSRLAAGELERARGWGRWLAHHVLPAPVGV